jgi:hypothetical protein
MAIALVRAGIVATGTATCAPAFGQSTTAGNLLVCRVGGYGSTVNATITIVGTGWTNAANGYDAANDCTSAIFYKANCGAGETAPSLALASGAALYADLTEWSGVATSSPLDQTSSAGGFANGDIFNNAEDTTASDLAIYAVGTFSATSDSVTFTDGWKPTGGTAKAAQGVTGGSKYHAWFSAYLLGGVGGAGADENGISHTGTINAYSTGGSMASFLPASGSPPINPIPRGGWFFGSEAA